MATTISEAVSVKLVYNHLKQTVKPEAIFWRGRVYVVTAIGLHHIFRQGRTLKHVFSVLCGATSFRLSLDTESLHWKLEEVNEEN